MYVRMIALLFVAMCLQNQAFAQEEKNTQYQFKVYSNIEYTSVKNVDVYYKSKSFNFGNITPSFIISKPKVSHEIGISRLSIGQRNYEQGEVSGSILMVTEGSNSTHFYLNMRYEYIVNLMKIKNKHQLSIAASAEPYIEYGKSIPRTSASFPVRYSTLGNKLHLIPRVTFPLSKRLFLDVNMPIEMMHLYRAITYTENPALTEAQRRFSDLDLIYNIKTPRNVLIHFEVFTILLILIKVPNLGRAIYSRFFGIVKKKFVP